MYAELRSPQNRTMHTMLCMVLSARLCLTLYTNVVIRSCVWLLLPTDKQKREEMGFDRKEEKNVLKEKWMNWRHLYFICIHGPRCARIARASTMQPLHRPFTAHISTDFFSASSVVSEFGFSFVFTWNSFYLHTHTHASRATRNTDTKRRLPSVTGMSENKNQNKYLTNGIESSVYILNTD